MIDLFKSGDYLNDLYLVKIISYRKIELVVLSYNT